MTIFLFSIFLTNLLDFTKTITPLALMASESIVHKAKRPNGLLIQSPFGLDELQVLDLSSILNVLNTLIAL